MQNYEMTGEGNGSSDSQSPLDARVIGLCIDFGMTGSSVSFYDGVIRQVSWKFSPRGTGPGAKIPTTISYDQDGIVSEWGFSLSQYRTRTHCLFKSLLDPDVWNQKRSKADGTQGCFNSLEAVRKCVKDYLIFILEAAFREILETLKHASIVVNLVCTHPTTWTAAVLEDYRNLARKAFKKAARRCSPTTSVWLNSIRLETESYAAGVFMFDENKRFIGEETSCFYILDVGGATTDPAFLQAFHDPSRPPTLKPVTKLQVPGVTMGCTDIDSRFADLVIGQLHSRLEHEISALGVEKFSSLSLTISTKANVLKFQNEWVGRRNNYSENTFFPDAGLKIRVIWSNDEDAGDHDLQPQNIIIERNDMEAIFETSLVTAIQGLIREAQQMLNSMKLEKGNPQNISHIMLCGGGGLLPRIYECVRDATECKIIRTEELGAASLGALALVRDEVEHLHATLKVGTRKGIQDDSDFVKLTGEEVQEFSFQKTLSFSHKWKQRKGIALLGQFILDINDYLPGPTRRERWNLRSLDATTGSISSGLQIFKSLKYRIVRICLTLPTTTSEITPIDFSAFLVEKDGQETRINCTAEKET